MEDLSVPCGSMTSPTWRITGGSLETVLFVPYGAEMEFISFELSEVLQWVCSYDRSSSWSSFRD